MLGNAKKNQQNPPALGGNTVWLSGKDGDGYNIELSADAKAKVNGILKGCGQADDKCYQGVREVLYDADLEIDSQLDRRGFAQLLSKTFKKAGAVFSFIASALMSNWYTRHQEVEDSGLFVPQAKASEASELATATKVTISAGGSAVVTVTPTPDPTKLQG